MSYLSTLLPTAAATTRFQLAATQPDFCKASSSSWSELSCSRPCSGSLCTPLFQGQAGSTSFDLDLPFQLHAFLPQRSPGCICMDVLFDGLQWASQCWLGFLLMHAISFAYPFFLSAPNFMWLVPSLSLKPSSWGSLLWSVYLDMMPLYCSLESISFLNHL